MAEIQQLVKRDPSSGSYETIFPTTYLDAVYDRESGTPLTEILNGFNMYFLSYVGSAQNTRLQVPPSVRRLGLWISYVQYDGSVVTEWYKGTLVDDISFASNDNWNIGSNSLVGDISISAGGNWVINGVDSGAPARGEAGISPIVIIENNKFRVSFDRGDSYIDLSQTPVFTQFRVHDNKLEQSVDLGATWVVVSDELAYQFRNSGNKLQVSKDLGVTWEDTSDYIAAWFRFTSVADVGGIDNIGKIQISRDNGSTWVDLSGVFTTNFTIKGYVATVGALPTGAAQGDVYGVGPTYDPADTGQTNPIYELYVKDSTGWVNNGRFTSITAGVVQVTGQSTTEVMSQKAVTDELNDLEQKVNMYGVATGTAQAQKLTVPATITALTPGMRFTFRPVAANTAEAPTLNVNNTGAIAILAGVNVGYSSALLPSDLLTIVDAIVEYDGTNYRLQNPQAQIANIKKHTVFNANAYLYGISDFSNEVTLQQAIQAAYDAGFSNVARAITYYNATDGVCLALFNSFAFASKWLTAGSWVVFNGKALTNISSNMLAISLLKMDSSQLTTLVGTQVATGVPVSNYTPIPQLVVGRKYVLITTFTETVTTADISTATSTQGSGRLIPYIYTNVAISAGTHIIEFTYLGGTYLSIHLNGLSLYSHVSEFAIYETLTNTIFDNIAIVEQLQSDMIAAQTFIDTVDLILPKSLGGYEIQDTSSGTYQLKNQNISWNGTRLKDGDLSESSSTLAKVSDPISIDRKLNYKITLQCGLYFDGCAYYSDENAMDYISNDILHADTDTIITAVLTIPENAKTMRFASKVETDYVLEIEIKEGELIEVASKQDLQNIDLPILTADVEQLQSDMIAAKEDISYLFAIEAVQGLIDIANAIKYVPTKDLFLSTNILDSSDATYDATYWDVIDGKPTYLGGGNETTPFVFNAATTIGKRYYCNIVTLTVNSAYENLFYLQIGGSELIDTYNGSRTTHGGAISDGGSFKIVPYGTKAFEVTTVTLKEILDSAESVGYDSTETITIDNIDCGNSTQTLIDGRWNVAIGPTVDTMANNINGTRSVAIGVNALKKWHTGLQNIAIGTFAASLLENGNHNVAIGGDAMWQAKTAEDNVVIGKGALGKTGEYSLLLRNTAIGAYSMDNQKALANDAVSIGYESNKYGASESVFIGSGATTSLANNAITNVIAIGFNAQPDASNQCRLGNTSVTDFILGNKRIIFHEDNSVTWEAI